MLWLLLGVVFVLYAVAWRVWQPFVTILRSEERAAALKTELDAEREKGIELRHELWATSTLEGVEREAARRGLGARGATRVRLRWVKVNGDDLRPASHFDSTAAWSREILEQNLGPLLDKLGRGRPIEPSEHNLTLE